MNTKKRLALLYSRIPANWLNESKLHSIPEARIEKYKEVLRNKVFNSKKEPTVSKVLINGDPSAIVQIALELSETPLEVYAIDFIQYFKESFDKDNTENIKPLPSGVKALFVYNIGAEPSINPTYASKLLNSLIKQQMFHNNGMIFLCSDLTKEKFYTTYGIGIANYIKLPTEKEESIF